MKIIVHRGTHQIGGCVIEIKTNHSRIFIDFGEELPPIGEEIKESTPLSIEGLTYDTPNCNGVFFTHCNGDHIGMYRHILDGIPLYMGAASKEIYLCLQNRIGKKKTEITEKIHLIENAEVFHAAQKIAVGDIKVTPFLVDHSILYMMHICF